MMAVTVDSLQVLHFGSARKHKDKTHKFIVLIKNFGSEIESEHLWDSINNGSCTEESYLQLNNYTSLRLCWQ